MVSPSPPASASATLHVRPYGGTKAAILDADFANGRFRWDGQTFLDETSFLAAIGGAKSGIRRGIGPYTLPGSPELFANADFADLSGWTSVLNGTSSVSAVAGVAQMQSDGSTGTGAGGAGLTADVTTEADTPYVLEAMIPNLGNPPALRFGSTLYGSEGGAFNMTAINTTYRVPVVGRATTSKAYLYRSAAGYGNFDRVSLKKATVFKNFAQGGFTGEIVAKAPPTLGSIKYLALWYGNDNTADCVIVFIDATGKIILRVVYAGVEQCYLQLAGTVAAGADFRFRFGVRANEFYSKLDNNPMVSDLAGSMPPLGRFVTGQRADGGQQWDGDIYRITLLSGGGLEQFLNYARPIYVDGDSFTTQASVQAIPGPLQVATERPVYSTGVGGATMNQIAARLAARTADQKAEANVVWDGDQNSITTVTAYCDLLAAGLVGYSKFVIIPPCGDWGQADASVELAVRDEMLARWPGNVLDWRSVLPMTGVTPTMAMFNNPGADPTHLGATAQGLIATAIKAFLDGRGW